MAPRYPQETICGTCGLIFASYPLPAEDIAPQHAATILSSAALCPHCAQPVRAGAQVCGACGISLVFIPELVRPGHALARGRYVVQRALSRGGMGVLYIAIDREAFDRTVVIKALLNYFDPADLQEAQAAKTRFLQEARVLTTLRHPAIPQVFSVFQEGPHNFIAMEYIDGHDLEQGLTHSDDATGMIVPGRPYAREDVLQWGIALCRVLEYLASRQPHPVVHHDIKPANLILDHNSNHIRLVDFGTARAPLPQASAGRPQPGVYGTPGYAPPEQYRGQSEPRSDVYALAATLYHLATDDDPRAHPFAFPSMGQLGTLGDSLRAALESDVFRRPFAGEFRGRLEAAIMSASAPVLGTPDGTLVRDETALARWCEAHWQQAVTWLYGSLPEQIELAWGRSRLAQDLRGVIRQHSADWNAGLDAALALLDPHDFGAAAPKLTADAQTLNFGPLPRLGREDRTLALTNAGRRWVQAHIQPPAWVTTDRSIVMLPPGQQTTVTLTVNMPRTLIGRSLRDDVLVRSGTATLLRLDAQTIVAYPRAFWRSSALLLAIITLVLIWPSLKSNILVYWARRDLLRPTARPAFIQPSASPQVVALKPIDATPYPIMAIQPSQPPQGLVPCLKPTVVAVTPSPTPMVITPITANSTDAGHPAPWQTGQIRIVKLLQQGDGVWNIAFSPDGQTLASGYGNGAVKLWRVADGASIRAIPGQHGDVARIVFSPDGQTFATIQDRTLTLWRMSDGALLHTLGGDYRYGMSMAFSPDGQILAAATDNGINLWRVADGELLRTLKGHRYEVRSVAFSPDGQILASVDQNEIRFWRVQDGTLHRFLTGQGKNLVNLVFSPDGQILASSAWPSGGLDFTITLWHAADGTPLRTIHCVAGEGLAFSPDGQVLASGGGGAVKLWRVADGEMIATLEEGSGGLRSLAFSPDGQLLAAGGDTTIKVWRTIP